MGGVLTSVAWRLRRRADRRTAMVVVNVYRVTLELGIEMSKNWIVWGDGS